jgi:hypothetical protein
MRDCRHDQIQPDRIMRQPGEIGQMLADAGLRRLIGARAKSRRAIFPTLRRCEVCFQVIRRNLVMTFD